jgi:hypothetical protein
MTVICAVMRKLIHLAYGLLKTGQPFDPEREKIARLSTQYLIRAAHQAFNLYSEEAP